MKVWLSGSKHTHSARLKLTHAGSLTSVTLTHPSRTALTQNDTVIIPPKHSRLMKNYIHE